MTSSHAHAIAYAWSPYKDRLLLKKLAPQLRRYEKKRREELGLDRILKESKSKGNVKKGGKSKKSQESEENEVEVIKSDSDFMIASLIQGIW